MKTLSRVSTFLFFLFWPSFLLATEPLEVLINEIAWMGNENSITDEWIELFNTTNHSINLEGWRIQAGDGSPNISLGGQILADSYFLLERTDESTVPAVESDLIYKGSLENNGEILELYDNSGNLIDSVNCSEGWFAGDNKTKQTMARRDSQLLGNESSVWQTSQNPGGTPKAKNSTVFPEEKLKKEDVTYPSDIVISEILPDPEGIADAEGEYIELFNKSREKVNLSGWKITDTVGSGAKAYTFPESTIIEGEDFLISYRKETGIILNNLNGDVIRLFWPSGQKIDEVAYDRAEKGKSYNLTESGWQWGSILSPGTTNVIEDPSFAAENPKSFSEEGTEKIHQEGIMQNGEAKQFTEKSLATVGKQTSNSLDFLSIFLIALTVSTFSAGFVLALKRKMKN